MKQNHGWVSYGSGENSHLTESQQRLAQELIRRRQQEGGELLGVVEVRAYENGCEPQITFPAEATLGVETDALVISNMLAQARDALADWR